jgi:hypothetical protein
LVGVLALAGAASGCGRRGAPLPLAGVPWEDGELGAYAWLEGESQVGTGSFGQRRAGQEWVIENSATLGLLEHRGSVTVDGTTLLPRSSEISVTGAPVPYEVEASFQQGKADLVARTSQGERTLAVKLPGGHYVDNDQLLTTIRCLPLAPGFGFTINVVNTVGGAWLPVLVQVEAVEQTELPVEGLEGTSHQVYRVGLMGGQQTAWYTVASPHIMLRYNNGERLCVLRSYRARGL